MNKTLTKTQKSRALANLDIEVADRLERFKAELQIALTIFENQNEGRLARIPDVVRKMTMREFAQKYKCNLDDACQGEQEPYVSPKKRKWATAREEEDPSRARKSARMMPATPKRTTHSSTVAGSTQRPRLAKTPAMPRVASKSRLPPPSPSPQKKPPFSTFGLGRPTSPSKHHAFVPSSPMRRAPSSATFNPAIQRTNHPTYPPVAARLPRRDESMLSINGSPLANPYDLGLGWFAESDKTEGSTRSKPNGLVKKTRSIINIRNDPSFSKDKAESSRTHSRAGNAAREPVTPKPFARTASGFALVAIPTKDGHFLEFDPLQTSPGAIEALEGITDSAKKQAKEEMGSLLQAAVDKWRIK